MPDPPLRLGVALNGYGLDNWAEDGGDRDILPWGDLRGLGQLAEQLGYERIFTPEIGGREAFSTLAGLGAATDHIGLATGVIPINAREIETTAMAASSLDEMTAGRLVLGLGSRETIERTGQLVKAVREVLAGSVGVFTDATGSIDGATGQTDWKMAPRRVPIYLAALGPRMVSVAGEVGEGVILNWCTPERVAEARAAIPRRDTFTLAVYVRACLSPVDEEAVKALKVAVDRYLRLQHYRRQLDAMGLGGLADEASRGAEVPTPPWERVPDELVEALCVSGEPGQARARLEEYRDAGADLVVVYPVAAGEALSSLTGTLMAAAPAT